MALDLLSAFGPLDSVRGTILSVAALLTAPYWLGPVVVRFGTRSAAAPRFVPFDPAAHREPPPVTRHMAESEAALAAEGFVRSADLLLSGYMDNQATRVRLFVSAAGEEAAVAAATYTSAGELGPLVAYVELATDFRDGRSHLTNNSPQIGAYGAHPARSVVRLPEVRDVALLCRAHRALVRRQAPRGSVAPCRYRGDAPRALAESMAREMEQQVTVGYLWLDRAAGAYRPTAKGAALMCWKLLPPVKQWRQAAAARSARRVLAEAGLER